MRSTRSSKLVWQNHENILLLDQRVCQTKKNFWPIILYSLWYFSWVENKQCESPHCNILVMDVVMVKKKFWLILLCCGFKTGYYICLASPIKGSVPFICHMKKLEQRFSMLAKRPESSNPASGKEGIASFVIICTANGTHAQRSKELTWWRKNAKK